MVLAVLLLVDVIVVLGIILTAAFADVQVVEFIASRVLIVVVICGSKTCGEDFENSERKRIDYYLKLE